MAESGGATSPPKRSCEEMCTRSPATVSMVTVVMVTGALWHLRERVRVANLTERASNLPRLSRDREGNTKICTILTSDHEETHGKHDRRRDGSTSVHM